MRAEIARIYIKQLLESLDTFKHENDKIMTGKLLCKLIFESDILFSQHGDYDKEFNEYFGQTVKKLHMLYPIDFNKEMREYEQYEEDIDMNDIN